MKRLVRAKCNKVVIVEFLHAAVVQEQKISEDLRNAREDTKRMALDLSREMNRLASQLESFQRGFVLGVTKEWPIGFPLEGEKDKFFPVALIEHLPSVLRGYAGLLQTTWGSNEFRQYFQAPPIDIPMLVAYLECFTGRPHYPELCTLLDAAECYTFGCPDDSRARGPDALRNSVNRFRKRHSSDANKMKELVSQYKNTYGAAQFSAGHFLTWMYQKQCEVPL